MGWMSPYSTLHGSRTVTFVPLPLLARQGEGAAVLLQDAATEIEAQAGAGDPLLLGRALPRDTPGTVGADTIR